MPLMVAYRQTIRRGTCPLGTLSIATYASLLEHSSPDDWPSMSDLPIMIDWPARWFNVAQQFASWSKDRTTHVGCVIVGQNNQVLSGGYNGFPRGVVDDVDERHDRPAKYLWTEHAERNAIYNAARHGISLDYSTMYVPYFPCADCARAIIQVGIRRIVTTDPTVMRDKEFFARWKSDFLVANEMMIEAEVDIVFIERFYV